MIGCEILKKIKIKCLVSNSLDIYKYHIKIYDSKGNIICDSSADDRGVLYFEPKYFEVYKVVVNIRAKIYPNKIIRNVIFTDNGCDTLVFAFKKLCPIVIKLTDKNYRNLKVEKGEIILWQDHIRLQ